MPIVRVITPGLFTTVQDLGRPGALRLGIPPSGAMDRLSLYIANVLVGNDPGVACLEMTLVGPRLEFESDSRIAITGAWKSLLIPVSHGARSPIPRVTRTGQTTCIPIARRSGHRLTSLTRFRWIFRKSSSSRAKGFGASSGKPMPMIMLTRRFFGMPRRPCTYPSAVVLLS